MNYLAHAYLSFQDHGILTGNMISDFVKGKKQFDYPSYIYKGIILHRKIDSYTDQHPVTRELKCFFVTAYRLYAGPLGDIVYDHFLARDTTIFADPENLKSFTGTVYKNLDAQYDWLPENFQKILPYMKDQDWLYNYRTTEGIKKSFEGLCRRATYIKTSAPAFDIFIQQYENIKACYDAFFPQLKEYAFTEFQKAMAG